MKASGKVPRTITIDSEINKIFKENPQINVSGLANKLLKQWLKETKRI